MKTLDDCLAEGVCGERVLLRADLNAPLQNGAVADDTRLRAALGSLQRLTRAGARVVLASHLGRPGGRIDPAFSLRPVAASLGALLGQELRLCPEVCGAQAEAEAGRLAEGEVLLLENLRFEKGETANDPEFAARLSRLADIYVNDAFGVAHRAHASTVGIAGRVARTAAGDLLLLEMRELEKVRRPARPLVCLLGGAKVSDKLAVLEALAPHSDVLCIGGAMAYTFLAAQGLPVGASMVEPGRIDDALRVLAAAKAAERRVLLPEDHVAAQRPAPGAKRRVVREIPEGWAGFDIGPDTRARFAEAIRGARTLFWNGPMGIYEVEAFAAGTEALARAAAQCPGHTIVGGGDSLAALARLGLEGRIGHLSTGGGAALAFVQGLSLPGIAALEQAA